MNFVKKILLSKFLIGLIGMVMIAVLIWFVGPLIGVGNAVPLDGAINRALVIIIMPAIWGLYSTIMRWREQATSGQMAAELGTPAANEAAAAKAADAEVGDLSNRLQEALKLLKKSKFAGSSGRRYLYQLPWYLFIGPPGSGKTTALINSGLNFPLADQIGKNAVKGVGGTRSCDWWFTDHAVLIDTAGRYTTQDSEQAADNKAWTGFLRLLKKYRKRQPINGAIVAIGISDLLAATEAQRKEHAGAIRARIKELYTELGVRFPIYVLFTKADLVAGFVEFFDDLSREDREQVWGMTFDMKSTDTERGAIAAYAGELDGLVGRLNDRLVERLQKETDIQRRSMIFGFPQQIASLKEMTETFLSEVFQPNRYEEAVIVRGVYLTSGTQDGTPIDRLMGAMASTFGIGRQQVSAFSGTGRSYFLTRLLREVVFGEAGLVSADAKLEKRKRIIQWAAYATAAVLVIGVGTAWAISYFNNVALSDQLEALAADYNQRVKAIETERVTDADLGKVLPLLNTLRDLPQGYAQRQASAPWTHGFGLFQGEKLGAQAIAAYRRGLNGILLPRMLLRLEGQLAANQARPDFLYEALKVYLILGSQGPLDKDLVKRWMTLDWTAQFPGPENEAGRKILLGHLDALLEKPLTAIQVNGKLVEDSRRVLANMPVAERAYSLLKTIPKVVALPEWRITDNAGPGATQVFVRPSGKQFADGIPGLFTHKGYYGTFRPLLPDIAKEVAKESWVLGASAKTTDDPNSIARLQRDVTSLYLEEFANYWDRLLADIKIAPFTSVSRAVQILNVLSGPESPIRGLVVSAARETRLSRPPPDAAAAGGLTAAATQAAQGVAAQAGAAAQAAAPAAAAPLLAGRAEAQLQSVLGAPIGASDDLAGSFTDRRFKPLHDLADGPAGSPNSIDGLVANLSDLYKAMNRVGSANDQGTALLGAAGGGAEASGIAQLQANAARMPEPIKTMVQEMTRSSSTITVGGARAQLNQIWTSTVLPFCRTATEDRYPIYKTGKTEVTLDDFSRLFSKGGLIDAFFATNLRPFVDTSTKPWRWQKVDNVDLGISPAVLAQFERSAFIRDSMFPGGGTKPGVSFELLPTTLDSKSTQVLLDVDGQTASYDHGPPRLQKMQWPGTAGPGQVRVSFAPQVPGEDTTIAKDGVWSFFRLLDDSKMKPSTGPDRFNVFFDVGTRSAGFEIRANSVVNPFASNQIEQFRCPPSL